MFRFLIGTLEVTYCLDFNCNLLYLHRTILRGFLALKSEKGGEFHLHTRVLIEKLDLTTVKLNCRRGLRSRS